MVSIKVQKFVVIKVKSAAGWSDDDNGALYGTQLQAGFGGVWLKSIQLTATGGGVIVHHEKNSLRFYRSALYVL